MSPSKTSTKATSILSTLTSPIRRVSLTAESPPSTKTTFTQTGPVVAESWLCHHCIYLLPSASANNSFSQQTCDGCGHDRCGLCDVVYSQSAEVVVPEEGQVKEMIFHWDSREATAVM